MKFVETGFRELGWDAAATDAAVDDELWSAIGDPMRRRILDLLLAGSAGTSTSLSEQLPVTRQAVAKHLGVLDEAGLAHDTARGRERHYEIDQAQFARAVARLNAVGTAWDGRRGRLDGAAVRPPRLGVMHHCSTKWATYLMSLRSLFETGTGAPSPHDLRVAEFD